MSECVFDTSFGLNAIRMGGIKMGGIKEIIILGGSIIYTELYLFFFFSFPVFTMECMDTGLFDAKNYSGSRAK